MGMGNLRGEVLCGQRTPPRTPPRKPYWMELNATHSICVPVKQKARNRFVPCFYYYPDCGTGTKADRITSHNIQSRFSLGERERGFLFQKKAPLAKTPSSIIPHDDGSRSRNGGGVRVLLLHRHPDPFQGYFPWPGQWPWPPAFPARRK